MHTPDVDTVHKRHAMWYAVWNTVAPPTAVPYDGWTQMLYHTVVVV
jgi:hypothetical protein